MRSKRVTKLLACVLSAAMCAGPTAVFASNAEYGDLDASGKGTIATDFGIYSPELKVTVPIKASVKVNPLSKNSVQTVKQFGLASKDLVITNKTIEGDTAADREGADLLVTVTGKITGKGANVKAFYEQGGFTPNGASKEKSLYMQLAAATVNRTSTAVTALSENNNYSLAADNEPYTQTITGVGSRIQFNIPGSQGTSVSTGTLSAGDYTYGAFAVIGNANTGADWVANDMTVELRYEIKANSSAGVAAPQLAGGSGVNITSSNGISVNNFIMDADRYGADVTEILLYDKTVDTPEVRWAVDSPSLTFARNAADNGYDFKISKDDPTIDYLSKITVASKKTGKYFLLVAFSDGRVSKAPITIL